MAAVHTYTGMNQTVLNKYMDLDTHGRVQAMYVWVDGSNETMRCKTKTLDYEPVEPKDVPVWNFDGSSTGQAKGSNSDTYLHPVAIFKDPFRRGKNKLVLCETYKYDHKPCESNKRKTCNQAMIKAKVSTFFLSLTAPSLVFPLRNFHSKNVYQIESFITSRLSLVYLFILCREFRFP